MEQVLKLTTSMPPSVNHYLAYKVVKTPRGSVAMSYKPKDVVMWQKNFGRYVTEEVKKQGWDIKALGDKHIYIETQFYFPRIDMDCDNYFKAMLDAITRTKIVWKDDNIVCERVNGILYDSKNPHIDILIYPVDYIGIFDNKEQLDEFEEKCKNCSRYSRNCSALQCAIEGRVQDGVTKTGCSNFKETRSKK